MPQPRHPVICYLQSINQLLRFRPRQREAWDPTQLEYCREMAGSAYKSSASASPCLKTAYQKVPRCPSFIFILPASTTLFLEILPVTQITFQPILDHKCT